MGRANGSIEPVYTALCTEIQHNTRVLHGDETSHRRNNEWRWMWSAASDRHVVFRAHHSRGQGAAKALIGEDFAHVLVSDQYVGYNWVPKERRQFCWAHIIRNLTRMAERGGATGMIGARLLLAALVVVRTQHRYDRGRLDPPRYRRRMKRLRGSFGRLLQTGADDPHLRSRNACKLLLKHQLSLWTFLRYDGVPITNNRAEQCIRPYVIWRKTSFATQSHRGDQFIARILSVVETCKTQARSVHDFLTELFQADYTGRELPSLV